MKTIEQYREIVTRIDALRLDRKQIYDCGDDNVDSLLAEAAQELSDIADELDAEAGLVWKFQSVITTAPRDGTMLMLWCPTGDSATAAWAIGWWNDRLEQWEDSQGRVDPTHWAALPRWPDWQPWPTSTAPNTSQRQALIDDRLLAGILYGEPLKK
jgi:hypothetical protein